MGSGDREKAGYVIIGSVRESYNSLIHVWGNRK